MRPVRRDISPQVDDFIPYDAALPYLIARIGRYCSYCERKINTQLAVEHIQPKGLAKYAHLEGSWPNFLLACVNCNSTKGSKDVLFLDYLLPDRDNTFLAYEYFADGRIRTSAYAADKGVQVLAQNTLTLVGLDKKISEVRDGNGKLVAIDRVAQRMEVWAIAEESRDDLSGAPGSAALQRQIVKTAVATGFFSIWMAVFSNDAIMRGNFVAAFAGTFESGCFDLVNSDAVPSPNLDGLPDGNKL